MSTEDKKTEKVGNDTIHGVISRFSNYRKSVMKEAWNNYKVKKRHIGYENWTFADSLFWAHKYISALKRNGL